MHADVSISPKLCVLLNICHGLGENIVAQDNFNEQVVLLKVGQNGKQDICMVEYLHVPSHKKWCNVVDAKHLPSLKHLKNGLALGSK